MGILRNKRGSLTGQKLMKSVKLCIIFSFICLLSSCSALSQSSLSKANELRSIFQLPGITGNDDGTLTQTFADGSKQLMWHRDADCIATNYGNIFKDNIAWTGKTSVFTFQEALEVINDMNSGKLPKCSLGFTDWRLPKIEELWSLGGFKAIILNSISRSEAKPLFKHVDIYGHYWSSTQAAEFGDRIWTWRCGGSTESTGVFPFPPSVPLNLWPVRDLR